MDETEGLTAAERVVARLDSYPQEVHAEGIRAARERATKRVARRKRRAQAAAQRLERDNR